MTHVPTLRDALAATADAYARGSAPANPAGLAVGRPAFPAPSRADRRARVVRSVRLAASAAALAAGLVLAATGCSKAGGADAGYRPGAIDLSSPAADEAPRRAPVGLMVAAPAAAAPAADEFPVIDFGATAAPAASTAGPRTHTVARGDTLYALATAYYGQGKQWTRIAEANPGVTPARLPAGQTIVIP